ncbi:MAG: hypothetical protein U5S82_16115 [Gammaproteobacteria bacterium]|nr:hypothetical protein [Gammaproteobacteria bacterium]
MNTLHQDTQRFEAWLADFDTRIQDLRHQVAAAQGYRQKGLQEELDKLLARRRKADEHMAQLRLADAESWSRNDFRTSIFAVFDDIGERLNRLMARV